MNEADYRRRIQEFPPSLWAVIDNNPAAHRIAQEYARGSICFLNEALAQMVIVLGTDWKNVQERAYRDMMMAQPVIVSEFVKKQVCREDRQECAE